MEDENKYLKELKQLMIEQLELVNKLHTIDDKITKLQNKRKIYIYQFHFKNGLCSSCHGLLSDEDIKDETIYCEECQENDSVLEYNSKLEYDSE